MKKFLFLPLLIAFMLSLQAQNSYWEEAKGPYGGYFEYTKLSNGVIYAILDYETLNHIYRSDDDGLNWVRLPEAGEAIQTTYIKSLTIGEAGTFIMQLRDEDYQNKGCYKSTDEGINWTPMDNDIVQLYETRNGVFIATKQITPDSSSVWRSADGGNNWTPCHPDLKIYTGADITTLYGAIATTWDNKLFRSSDDGLTWSVQPMSQTISNLYFLPSGIILGIDAGHADKHIYRSVDGGASFSPVYSVSSPNGLTFMILNSGRVLLQTLSDSNDLYYSDNEGATWGLLANIDSGAGGYLQEIAPLPDGTIFKEELYVLYRSQDGGQTWQFSARGLRTSLVYDMKFISDSVYYALTIGGLWRTDDAGEDWKFCTQFHQSNTTFLKNRFAINQTGEVVVINDESLLWSNDFGDTFTDITPLPASNLNPISVSLDPSNNAIFASIVGAGANAKTLRSTDFGQNWETVLDSTYAESFAFHPSGRIIANCNGSIRTSDDGGSTWTLQQVFGTSNSETIAAVAPNGDVYLSKSDELWKSKDAGESWNKLPIPLQDGPASYRNTLLIASNGHLYLINWGTYSLLLSVNEGYTWQNIAEEIPYTPVYHTYYSVALTPGQRLIACGWDEPPQLFQTSQPVTQGAYIEGHVRLDADADCSTSDAQMPIENRIVRAEGENYAYLTNTGPDGHYVFFADTGAYQVSVNNPSGIWWGYCEDTLAVNLPEMFASDTADFVAIPLSYCPLMTVNVAIPFLRRCFDSEVYVQYCNQGTEPADSAWVDVMLDPYLTLVNSSQPHVDLGGNTIRFFVGDMVSGQCGQFQLTVHVDCDSTVIGQTHCVMAHGFPDTLCTVVQDWSGANLEASVICENDSLELHLRNTGNAPSQSLDFIIIEDDVVLFSGQHDYDVAEDAVYHYAANGHTWRIESEQEPGHPFSTLALAFSEGCGGFNSLGYINQFTVNGIEPSWHRACVENSGAYDPNDKQGFPIGTGTDHNILPGQTINYLIRFQNTGNDTAFTVVLRDTLSHLLDPSSLRPGASSHPYTWSLSGQGAITFSFNNIMLPDSNVNEPRSHGFVQFSIAPYAELPFGSVIENNAAIYFDFNEPVITNTTWHTIQNKILDSGILPEPAPGDWGLKVWPNPFNEYASIHLERKTGEALLLRIFDSTGKLVSQKRASGSDIEFNGKHLPPGMYWAEVQDAQGRLIGRGKLLKK